MTTALIAVSSGPGYITIFPSGDTTGVADTATIQAAFNILGSSSSAANHSLSFANGEWYINAKCQLTFSASTASQISMTINGNMSRITQVTSNTGIFEMVVPAGGFPSGPKWDNFHFNWTNPQTHTDSASVAIGARSALTTGTGAETLSNVTVRNCRTTNCYTFIGNTQPMGSFSFWNLNFEQNDVNGYSGPVLNLASPTAVGSPNISIKHLTTAQPTSDNVSPEVNIVACDNLLIENFESLLHVNNFPMIFLSSVSSFVIQACKAEASAWGPQVTGPLFNKVIMLENSYGFVGPFTLNNATINTGSGFPPIWLSVEAGLNGQTVTAVAPVVINPPGSGTLTLFNPDPIRVNVLGSPNLINLGSVTVRLTNSGSGPQLAFLNFDSPPGGAMPAADQGDASFTLSNPLTTPQTLIWNTAFTANRTVTLSASHGSAVADNLWDGAKIRVIRTAAASGFTLTINGTSIPTSLTVASGHWAQFEYSYALGWVEVEAGSL
jgi:hypothetical protein